MKKWVMGFFFSLLWVGAFWLVSTVTINANSWHNGIPAFLKGKLWRTGINYGKNGEPKYTYLTCQNLSYLRFKNSWQKGTYGLKDCHYTKLGRNSDQSTNYSIEGKLPGGTTEYYMGLIVTPSKKMLAMTYRPFRLKELQQKAKNPDNWNDYRQFTAFPKWHGRVFK